MYYVSCCARFGLLSRRAHLQRIVAAIVVVIGFGAAASRKAALQEGLEVESLNKKYRQLAAALKRAVMKKTEWKAETKADKARDKAEAKSEEKRTRAFVIDFKGDLKASAVPSLRARNTRPTRDSSPSPVLPTFGTRTALTSARPGTEVSTSYTCAAPPLR